MAEVKTCSRCKVEHPVREFSVNRQKKDGLHSFCKKQQAAKIKAERETDPDRFNLYSFKSRLKTYYNLTLEQYEELLDRQGGTCAICQVESPRGKWFRNWHVDHDHSCCPGARSCGKCVRGLLCNVCNRAIGFLQDDPQIIRRALEYVS